MRKRSFLMDYVVELANPPAQQQQQQSFVTFKEWFHGNRWTKEVNNKITKALKKAIHSEPNKTQIKVAISLVCGHLDPLDMSVPLDTLCVMGGGQTQLKFLCVAGATRKQCPGRFLGIICQYPSVSQSNQLHVDIFNSCLLFEVCSLNSYRMMGSNLPKILNFNRVFLKLNWLICSYRLVMPVHCVEGR